MPLDESWEPKGEHVVITEDGPVKLNIRRLDSSNIDWIGWPVSGESLMVVNFKDGSRYGYVGVSRQRAVAMAYAWSSGSYLAMYIKPFYKVYQLR